MHREDTVHLKEVCCREERGEEVKEESKEKNSQGKDPRTTKENSHGEDPSTSSLWGSR